VRAAHRNVVRQIEELTRHDVRPDNRGGFRRVQIRRDQASAKKLSKPRRQEVALRKQMARLLDQGRSLTNAAGARREPLPNRPRSDRPGAPDNPPEGMLDPRGLRKTMTPEQLSALARGEHRHAAEEGLRPSSVDVRTEAAQASLDVERQRRSRACPRGPPGARRLAAGRRARQRQRGAHAPDHGHG